MQSASRRRKQVSAAHQIDAVIGVASIRRAAPHGHQPLGPEPSQVVGDQALAAPGQGAQLAYLPIAAPELAQQLPAQRVPGHAHEARGRHGRAFVHCGHGREDYIKLI
jgi:hypothetical protein